ncbi:MAG: molybdopterin cofactor-binding domain-containing protein, partial [Clostridiales bacterium]
MTIGVSYPRVDACDKVTGAAKYTEDLCPTHALWAKIYHSTIANGRVRCIHTQRAAAIPGVVKIFTCFDVPQFCFGTAGHPWAIDPGHQDIADRLLLNQRVRLYGDDIAVVVAEDEITANRALGLIEVEYDTYPVLLTPQEALLPGAGDIHEEFPGNLLRRHSYSQGELTQAVAEPGLVKVSGHYCTQQVQHCHVETANSFAYQEAGKLVVVSSTQIPHIARRIIGQAVGLPWGKIRVIKPYIGGGFGNKQELLTEPLNAWLAQQLPGETIRLALSREEVFFATRVRHGMAFDIEAWARADGTLVARRYYVLSNQGAYASHGHGVAANALNAFHDLYQDEKAIYQEAATVYTNGITAGAMRGYGIPQGTFAAEAHMDDVAAALGMDPIALRLRNLTEQGFTDPATGITCHSNGLRQCLEKGARYIDWQAKRAAYSCQQGSLRRGVGMAAFCYKTGVYPISLETASARLVLNQDGSCQLQLGATEIGQGADTVFCQIAAAAIGMNDQDVHIVTVQDTDVAPFDPGAYASRQTYVSGKAVKKAGELFRERILAYAALLTDVPADALTIEGQAVMEKYSGRKVISLEDVAMGAFYSLTDSRHITAEATSHCQDNTFSFGCAFAEIEVDLPLGKISV